MTKFQRPPRRWFDIPGGTIVPAAHAPSHEDGGTDEIDVTGLSGLLADEQDPLNHAADHEDGGGDEIDVTNLSGLLADPQTPIAHHLDHEDGGGDEIDVTGLSGLLADAQTPIPTAGVDTTAIHDNVDSEISAIALKAVPLAADFLIIEDTVALNVKKSTTAGAIAALGGGPPAAHANTHENLGFDEIDVTNLSGLLADPQTPIPTAGVDTTAIHNNVDGEIDAIVAKVPVAADEILLEDSAVAWAKKKATITDLSTAVIHNSLSGLQGGTATQYYHLTQAQHTRVNYTYTLWVGAGCDYANVQAALTAAALLPLSTTQRCLIMVLPGMYAEVNPLSSVAWVDVVGLGGDPRDTVIRCTVAGLRLFNWSGAHYMGLSNLTLDGNAIGHTGCYNAVAGGSTFCRNVRSINFTTNGFLFSGITAELHDIVTSGNLYGIRIGATTTVFGFNIELGDVTSGILNSGGTFYAWNYYAHNVGNAIAVDNAAARNYVWGGLFNQNAIAVRHFTASGAESWIHNVRFQNAVTWDLQFVNVGGEIHLIGCTADPTKWSLGATPGRVFVQDWGSSPYVVKVGSDPEHGFISVKAAIDYLQTTGLSATQRGRVEIEPGTYVLTAACDLDSYIDIVGRGDVPNAVQITSALNTDAFQDMGVSTWSLRNLQITANGNGWCVDANVAGGGGGTLEDVVLVAGNGGGALRAENDIVISGKVLLRASATSTSLLTISGSGTVKGTRLELDDAVASGAGIDLNVGVLWLDIIDAESKANTGDGIGSTNAADSIWIKGGRIVGWQDAMDFSATSVALLANLDLFGATNDIRTTAGAYIRVSNVSMDPTRLTLVAASAILGPWLDGTAEVRSGFDVTDTTGVALVSGAWTPIIWDVQRKVGQRWAHTVGQSNVYLRSSASSGIVSFVELQFNVTIQDDNGGDLQIGVALERNTGAGWVVVPNAYAFMTLAPYTGSPGISLGNLSRTFILDGPELNGYQYRVVGWFQAGSVHVVHTCADSSNFRGFVGF